MSNCAHAILHTTVSASDMEIIMFDRRHSSSCVIYDTKQFAFTDCLERRSAKVRSNTHGITYLEELLDVHQIGRDAEVWLGWQRLRYGLFIEHNWLWHPLYALLSRQSQPQPGREVAGPAEDINDGRLVTSHKITHCSYGLGVIKMLEVILETLIEMACREDNKKA